MVQQVTSHPDDVDSDDEYVEPDVPDVDDIDPPSDDDGSDDGRGGDGKPIKWVTVATFWKPDEAHIARLKLESLDIPVMLADENLIATDWLYANAAGGIKVQVPEEAAADATEALRQKSPGVLEYASPETGMPVTVARFPESAEAHLAANLLESGGVSATVSEVGRGRVALLSVDSLDRDKAIAALQASPAAKYLVSGNWWEDPDRSTAAPPVCPECGSANVRRAFQWWLWSALTIVMILGASVVATRVPILFAALMLLSLAMVLLSPPRLKCRSCGHHWTAAADKSR